jgi:hypothetical protein
LAKGLATVLLPKKGRERNQEILWVYLKQCPGNGRDGKGFEQKYY